MSEKTFHRFTIFIFLAALVGFALIFNDYLAFGAAFCIAVLALYWIVHIFDGRLKQPARTGRAAAGTILLLVIWLLPNLFIGLDRENDKGNPEQTAYRNVRAQADKVCPEVIGKFPNNVVNTKAFRDKNPNLSDAQVDAIQRSVSQCEDYAKYGAEWRADVAKDTLDCIGWKAGLVRQDWFAWCKYYKNTPDEPTPAQIASFQQAHYATVCKEREQAGTIRRLVELRYSKWCDGYQPQQIDATATTASTQADKPASNDLWK